MLYQITRCNAVGYSNNNEVSDCVYVMQLKFTAVLEKVDIAITIVSSLLLCSRDIALIFNRNFNCTEREGSIANDWCFRCHAVVKYLLISPALFAWVVQVTTGFVVVVTRQQELAVTLGLERPRFAMAFYWLVTSKINTQLWAVLGKHPGVNHGLPQLHLSLNVFSHPLSLWWLIGISDALFKVIWHISQYHILIKKIV